MQKRSISFLVLTLAISHYLMAQKPTINSVDKNSAATSEMVTLSGSDFGTDQTKLRVFFGAVQGEINSVSNQLIEVRTPGGATYDNIAISNTDNGLTGYSPSQFFLNYKGEHVLAAANFGTQTDFNAENGLYDLCLCDFNNDNKVDVATASDESNSMAIFSNGSTVGTFTLTRSNTLINAKSFQSICGDLNGDGLSDLVLSEGGDGTRIFIFKNNGGFTFSIQSINLTGRRPTRVAIADLDLDGKPEIVTTDRSNGGITFLPNQSTTSSIVFGSPVTLPIPGVARTYALEIKDVNGNGLPDILTAQFNDIGQIYIFENKSSPGSFNLTDIKTITVNSSIANIRVGDLDGDNKPDIAATRLLGSDIAIFRNQSTSSEIIFSALTPVVTHARPWGVDFGDFDGDGKTDIATASISSKSITVLHNESTSGAFSFRPMISLNTTFINRHVKIGDIDTDGKPDIVFTSINDNGLGISASKVSVIRNKSCMVPAVTPVGPLTVCTGFPLQLTATQSGGVTYDWKKNAVTEKTGSEAFLDITTSGAYTVTASAESGSCVKTSNTVNITVEAGGGLSPTDPDARSNSPVCTEDVLNLQVTDIGATQYRWIGPNGFTATGLTASIANFSIENAGLYIVEMIVGTCVAKTDSTIVEGISNPDFTVAFSGSDLICQGSTKVLSVSPVMTSGFTYQWFEKTLGSLAGQTNSTFSATTTGEYRVQVISSHPGCSPVETPEVKITAVAIPDANFTPSVTTACVGQDITFTNESTVDPQATPVYTWTFGDTNTSSEVSPVHSYTQANTFQVKLHAAYQGDICPNEETKSVTVMSAPAVSITSAQNIFNICPSDTLRLSVSGGPFTSISWSTGATTPSILIDQAAEYSVEVTTAAGCILEVSKVISSITGPTVTALANPGQIKVGETTQLSATGGLVAYTWRPGNTVSDSTSANTIATPLQTTTYMVFGRDLNNCYGEGSVEVIVTGTSALDLIIPKNYFSPNDDSINPTWEVQNSDNFTECAVAVYNDKGAKVFEAKPYLNTWDGTFKGNKLPAGVYYYVIRCDGNPKSKTGSITLLR